MREARAGRGVVAGRVEPRGKIRKTEAETLRQAIKRGLDWRPRADIGKSGRCAPSGVHRRPRGQDPRRDSELLAAIARVAPGTELRQGIDDIIRADLGALIVIGDPNDAAVPVLGRHAARPAVHAAAPVRAGQDGRRDHPRHERRAASCTRTSSSCPTRRSPPRRRDAAPHRRARRQADGRARDLDLAAARDRHALRGRPPLPARARSPTCSPRRTRPSRRSRRTASGSTRCCTRLTALEFQNAVDARRRARGPAARRADDADGRGDRARLRRARLARAA